MILMIQPVGKANELPSYFQVTIRGTSEELILLASKLQESARTPSAAVSLRTEGDAGTPLEFVLVRNGAAVERELGN